MPMIELTVPAGALSEAERADVQRELAAVDVTVPQGALTKGAADA
ncbi:hypothetical protein [Kibdelosporangium aridum]